MDKKDVIVKLESLHHKMNQISNCLQHDIYEAVTRLEIDKVVILVKMEYLQTESEINDTKWKTQIEQRNVKSLLCHLTTNDAIPISNSCG